MRKDEAAILSSLPAHIALLDAQGRIVFVNESWRQFGKASVSHGPGYGIGLNYLEICDRAGEDDSSESHQVAVGIRAVLSGELKIYSIEYPCHSPTEQRWFLLTVTPRTDDIRSGAVVMHLDITERKRGEETFRRVGAAMDAIADAIFVVDRSSMRFVYVNDAACRLQNQSREELLALEPWVAMSTSRAELERTYDAVIASGVDTDPEPLEIQLSSPDGSAVWLELRRHVERARDGWMVVSLVRDITERKQATLELRESERRFRDLLGNVELISLMLDCEGRITYCNWYLLHLTGWRREEILGKNWFDISAVPESREQKGELFSAILANLPEAWHHESEILTRSGERRLVRWNNSVLQSVAGDVIGTASIGEDITEQRRAEEALIQLRRTSDLILESIDEGIIGIDPEGRIIFENPASARLLGYSPNELLGKSVHASVHHSRKDGTVYPIADSPIVATSQDGVIRTVEGDVFWRKDGTSFPVEFTTGPIRNDRDDITGQVLAFRDITSRKASERTIVRLNRVYAMLSGINALIVRERDRTGLFREACRIAVEEGGFRMSLIAIVDQRTAKIVPVASAGKSEELLSAITALLSSSEGASGTMIARAIRGKKAVVSNDSQSDQSVFFGRMYVEADVLSIAAFPLIVAEEAVGVFALYASESNFFHDEEMKLLTELAGDIAFGIDHIEKQERLDYLAYYDVLTGLANRSLFLERVAQYARSAVNGGHKLAVFLIDLERFKNINDSLGRPAGDALLKQVAEWLTHDTGDANLLARVGADLFAAVLPEIRPEGDVVHLLEKWMAALLNHPFHLKDAVFRISARVGVALFPNDGTDADTLFRNAEAALKKTKASGERYLFYTQNMTETTAGKVTLENQLRRALDRGEFVLHYQPKANIVSGKVTSAEALIRWNDPRSGLVPPNQFIPVLEETGLIYEVGRWALRHAIEDYLRWRRAGLPAVRIAVNVSPLQLRNRGFVAEVEQVISVDSHAAAGLELELTESLIMADVKRSIASLQAIRATGVRIAIDDFGTGFSSLSYLAKLPLDTLKIDRSFVLDMTAGPEGLALVSTIVNLAHSLELTVVAEGVETEEQLRLLRLMQCDEMQGYLFSKPVPREVFETRYLAAGIAG